MKPRKGNRAALYARYSTDRQCSTAVQISKMLDYCCQNNLIADPAHIYKDEGKTGMRTNRRDGYQALLSAARAGDFDCVVLYDLTRGDRDVVNWFTFRREMMGLGITVLSLHDHLGNIDDPADFLPELISVGMGQSHVLTSRLKSMDKIDYMAQQGKFCGGYAPLGYRIENGQYVIVDSEAPIIRAIFALYADGHSYSDILAALPTDLRGRRGRPLGKNSLFEILRNERYIGTYSWCKRQVKYFTAWAGGEPSERAVVIDDAIPAIIDKETWKRVQQRMQNNKKNRTNHGRREYLLSGLLYCGQCGSAFGGITTTNKKGYEYKHYVCLNKHRTRTCKAKNISANDIEPLVCALLRHALLDETAINATADAIIAAGHRQKDVENPAALKELLANTEGKITNLINVLAGGVNSNAIREKLISLENEKKALQIKIDNACPRSEELRRENIVELLHKDAEALRKDETYLKQLIKKYIIRIDVYDNELKICSTANLEPMALPNLSITPKTTYTTVQMNDGVSTDGCGDRI